MSIGFLPAKGKSGRKWLCKMDAPGVMKVQLEDLSPRRPGKLQVEIKAKRWFTAAAANLAAGDTQLLFTLGGRCFSHVVTKKLD